MTDTQKNAAVEAVVGRCRSILRAVAASGRVEEIDLHNLRAAKSALGEEKAS